MIEVWCELDILAAPSLTQLLLQELSGECRGLIVDMSRCEFPGSSGMSALLEAKQQADSMAVPIVPIVPAGIKPIAARALQVTRLESMFPTYPSAEEAMSALSG
ncbi:MAG TPA: STAS domain-containing protein [Pseudonocardiaceae bacterium]